MLFAEFGLRLKIPFFWDVMLYPWARVSRRFEIYLEDQGTTVLRNFEKPLYQEHGVTCLKTGMLKSPAVGIWGTAGQCLVKGERNRK
jgi:hypothetical protein